MSKTHCVTLSKMPDSWEGLEVKALCGAYVKDARPVWKLNFQTFQVEGMNTVMFCEVCFPLAVLPVDERAYVVGILPAEEAMRFNADLSDDL